MLFEDTTLLLIWIACTYVVVHVILRLHSSVKSTAVEIHNKIVRRLDEIVHRVLVEKQGEVYYWFDQDNNKFLAQGRTTEEILTVIKSRFPDHIFYFEESNHLICAKHNWEPQPARLTSNSQ
jgi:hypothetical protein